MNLSRREFLSLLYAASIAGLPLPKTSASSHTSRDYYDIPVKGNVSLLHFTDCHAQLLPVYYREPSINIGVGDMRNQAPHIVDRNFLAQYGIKENSCEAYALSSVNFTEAAQTYGKVGGFSYLATLIKKLRAQRPDCLLLDGGDTWQGSATSLWTQGADMIDAQIILGVDAMTMHWEMTYGAEWVQKVVNERFPGHVEFLAQNIFDTEWEELVFKPYTLREINQIPVAIIGQAFPYTPIANPRHFVPDWSFGVRDEHLQAVIDQARGEGAQLVVLLSHNGFDVDKKLAARVQGLDVILGGHTHDAIPIPIEVIKGNERTLVINSGSNGKFLSVLDLNVQNGKLKDFQYRLLPIFPTLLEKDTEMEQHIQSVRQPYLEKLNAEIATTDTTLYRRGNFNGTFDQLICDALISEMETEISFSPGFRWGTTLLPGQTITFEDIMTQTAITYPETTRSVYSGEQIKMILEDVADNLFNSDPYQQQGGDMVRTGGLRYTIEPNQTRGKRIQNMEVNGERLSPSKHYSVAGWASVAPNPEGPPVWDVVSSYLASKKVITEINLNKPTINGTKNNLGIA